MYEDYQSRAFAGMKGDSGDDRVESFPVGAAGLGLGLVTGTDASGVLVAGAGTKVRGISLHSHTINGAGYVQYDCASVMTKGHVWAQVAAGGAVTVDGPVSFAADGRVANAGTALPNAVFRSGIVAVTDPAGVSSNVALVELHNPFAVPPAAP
ncbi:hypothetical protein ABE583_02830 [Stenotrophomonas sp. TWI143]|uniref:structural cement protein Gp24 n=1 Tax=Stenotrophomonas sp. TWI143 TaxID=3136771 RepID=UPI0032095394